MKKMSEHPFPFYKADMGSSFLKSKGMRGFLTAFDIVRDMSLVVLAFCIVVILGAGVSIGIVLIMGWFHTIIYPVACIVVYYLLEPLFEKCTEKMRWLRLMPLRCSCCSKFMESNSRSLESPGKADVVVFYECRQCKLYIDSGITID